MELALKLQNREEKLAVVGLGYVGLPLAVAFSRQLTVIGLDINKEKILKYRQGIDPTGEAGNEAVARCGVDFTWDESRLKEARFIIVAVPTPVNMDKTPDLTPLVSACERIGRNLCPGAVVVFESTVYPGVTEEVCVPAMEKASGLRCGVDFKVGYSPERINPGDRVHRLDNIVKIVSGMDEESCELIAEVYGWIVSAGIHKVGSIKAAEAAKVAENSQRDINIAFMNELAMVFEKMGIDTQEVIEAMNTKWNALRFYPGLVGGHCIGVDPYYFIYEAEKLGYHSQIILAGRKINDGMADFVVQNVIRQLILSGKVVNRARVAILGLTFKENCPDIRNSKVFDILDGLKSYGMEPVLADPEASPEDVRAACGMEISALEDIRNMDCLIVAVAHSAYKELSVADLQKMCPAEGATPDLIADIKGIFDRKALEEAGFRYWRL